MGVVSAWEGGVSRDRRAPLADLWRESCPLLQEVSSEALARAAGDPELIARAAELEDAFATDIRRPSVGPIAPDRPVAFLCAEFGVHHSLPMYSGGLGALAGDLVKEASDQALPLVVVGRLYRQGYFSNSV